MIEFFQAHGHAILIGCTAFNCGMFGHSLAKRERWSTVWFGFWALACVAGA